MRLNHALVMASDVSEMTKFFKESLGLSEGYRPPFEFEGAWLYDDQNMPCIHIANRDNVNPQQAEYLRQNSAPTSLSGINTIDHLAFSTEDYSGLVRRLVRHKLPFIERDVPASEEHQVFVFGPDDLKIEIVFDRKQLLSLTHKNKLTANRN